MGRKRKYFSEEQIKNANRKKAEKYYKDNINIIREKNLKKYYDSKLQIDTTGSFTVIKP